MSWSSFAKLCSMSWRLGLLQREQIFRKFASTTPNNLEIMADEKTISPAEATSRGGENALSTKIEDQDVAIAIVGEHRQQLDPAAEARVVRKIDLFLIPAMIVLYGFVYYDSK